MRIAYFLDAQDNAKDLVNIVFRVPVALSACNPILTRVLNITNK